MNLKEDVVLQGCLDYLKLRGLFVWRNNTGSCKIGKRYIRFGYIGSSDILGICPDGRFLAVECKREKGGIVSQNQKIFLAEINARGGVGIIVHSVKELSEKLEIILNNNLTTNKEKCNIKS